MRAADIANALEQHLGEIPDVLTIVWENQDAQPVAPYIEVQNVRTSVRDGTIAGGAAVHEGYLVLTVVTAQNTFATPANAVADDLAAWFPMGHRLAVLGGGHVVIPRPARVLQGFPDGANWRTPVRVEYQAMGA